MRTFLTTDRCRNGREVLGWRGGAGFTAPSAPWREDESFRRAGPGRQPAGRSGRLAALALTGYLVLGRGLAGWAAEWRVGPGEAFSRVEAAVAAAQPGDTVLVLPLPGNVPYPQVALRLTRPRVVVRAAGPADAPVPLSGRGYDYTGHGATPRAIVQFEPGADDCVLEGFELFGAHNDSHNGAGVRINQANRVTVRHCVIHDNDMGVMSNGDGTPACGVDQLIERCRIFNNGDLSHPGYNHNLYLGGTSVTVLGCEIHSSLTGHNVKSRAHRTLVLGCYVHDSANREFDLVDAVGDTTVAGSDAVLAGNIIVKAPDCRGNRGVVHFGQDGGHEHDGTVYLAHNTIVTPFQSPVVYLSAGRARAALFNNLLWSGGGQASGQVLVDGYAVSNRVTGAGNWLSAGFSGAALDRLPLRSTRVAAAGTANPFVNTQAGDYRLAAGLPGLADTGQPLPPQLTQILGRPLVEYRPGPDWQPRADDGKPDAGAHEFVPARGRDAARASDTR